MMIKTLGMKIICQQNIISKLKSNLPFRISMTLPDKSCPTLGAPPCRKFKLFEEGDFVLLEVTMLKLFANDFCCNCPGFPTREPAVNIFEEKLGILPISVPKAGVEITDGLTLGEFSLEDPNIVGLLIALS